MKDHTDKIKSPAIEIAKNSTPLRLLFYVVAVIGVLILAVLSMIGRLSIWLDLHDRIFGR